MKRALLGMALVVGLLSSTGCKTLNHNNCNNCNGNVGCRPCNLGWQRGGTDHQRFLGNNGSHVAPNGSHGGGANGGGGPAAQVAYPYYTVRGPRDFLASNPASIGR